MLKGLQHLIFRFLRGKKREDVGRKSSDKGIRHASEDAEASHGFCFSSPRHLWCFWLRLHSGPHQEGDTTTIYQSVLLNPYVVLWVTGFDCWVLKLQEFDGLFGCGWQCVVGSNFGCFFTHSQGTFIYFAMETLNFLVFKAPSSSPSWCLHWKRQTWDNHMGCHFHSFFVWW